jgi:hypothetical protein
MAERGSAQGCGERMLIRLGWYVMSVLALGVAAYASMDDAILRADVWGRDTPNLSGAGSADCRVPIRSCLRYGGVGQLGFELALRRVGAPIRFFSARSSGTLMIILNCPMNEKSPCLIHDGMLRWPFGEDRT